MLHSSTASGSVLFSLLLLAACGAAWGCATGEDPGPELQGNAGAGAGASDAGVGGKAGSAGQAAGNGGGGAAGAGNGGAAGTGGSAGNCHAVINELMAGSNSSASDEFVEISNPCSSSLDLTGWRLVYRSSSGTTDVTLYKWTSGSIAAGGYSVIAGTAYTGGATADGVFASGGLASGGGGVGLQDADGAVVDSLGYGSATNDLIEGNPAAAPPDGQSVGRLPGLADTNDNAADFQTFTSPSPGAANSP
ncbi:MAG: lamin tail domain-containing protein [Deltaproteobacteria bacterium]|nr:lamin tail domain-containing protein [Deltaproteobacteria bacterium]